MTKTIDLFFAYAREDEALRDQLEKHLAPLKRQGVIHGWHDRQIGAGTDWKSAIDKHLEAADVILLLVSVDFLASDYCYDVELKGALARHAAGEARVIPVILRHCDWNSSPFAQLQALPRDAKPITRWEDRDEAWIDVVRGIRRAIEDLPRKSTTEPPEPAPERPAVGKDSAPLTSSIAFLSKLKPALIHARDILIADGTLGGFESVTGRHWQEAHERIGWRLFTSLKRDCFAFMGIYHGDRTLQRGSPDLYFFLEMNPTGSARRAMDAQKEKIKAKLKHIEATSPGITWQYEPGGWESIRALKSMAHIPEASFQAEAVDFFRTSATCLRDCGILDEFLALARAQAE